VDVAPVAARVVILVGVVVDDAGEVDVDDFEMDNDADRVTDCERERIVSMDSLVGVAVRSGAGNRDIDVLGVAVMVGGYQDTRDSLASDLKTKQKK